MTNNELDELEAALWAARCRKDARSPLKLELETSSGEIKFGIVCQLISPQMSGASHVVVTPEKRILFAGETERYNLVLAQELIKDEYTIVGATGF